MKKQSFKTILIGIITVIIIILSHLIKAEIMTNNQSSVIHATIPEDVITLLEAKCNSCHRKKNPFMVFSAKNLNKRAEKIYEQVFVKKRMPKGGKLSDGDYELLKKWLESKI